MEVILRLYPCLVMCRLLTGWMAAWFICKETVKDGAITMLDAEGFSVEKVTIASFLCRYLNRDQYVRRMATLRWHYLQTLSILVRVYGQLLLLAWMMV